MSFRRIGVLARKELLYSSKSLLFVFAVVTPIVTSLAVSLIFGTLFSGKPQLGIVDEGNSQLVPMLGGMEFLVSQEYDSVAGLRQAVAAGRVDAGMVLPTGFDELLARGQWMELRFFVWGESLISSRAIVVATLADLIQEMMGLETAVEVTSTTIGEGKSASWEARLLPLLVLLAVIMGGSLVPAASLVDEKEKHTLTALVTTPTSLREVLLAKGLLGVILSLVTAVIILLLNRILGTQVWLLLLVLALGGVLAATFGILLGLFTKDSNTLFATVKAIALLLYAPALINLFPQLPQWIAKIFPTYYVVAPVIEITQEGGRFADVAPEIAILSGLVLALLGGVTVATAKVKW